MPGPGRGRGRVNRYRLPSQTKLANMRNKEAAARHRLAKQARVDHANDENEGFFSDLKRALEAALPQEKRRKLHHHHRRKTTSHHCPNSPADVAATKMAPSHPKRHADLPTTISESFTNFAKWFLPKYNNRQWRIDNGLLVSEWKHHFSIGTAKSAGTILVFYLSTAAEGVNHASNRIILGATLFRRKPSVHAREAPKECQIKPEAAVSSSPVHLTYELHNRVYLEFDKTSCTVIGRWTDAAAPDIFGLVLNRLRRQQAADEVHVMRDEECFQRADKDGKLNHRCENALCLFATEPLWMKGKG